MSTQSGQPDLIIAEVELARQWNASREATASRAKTRRLCIALALTVIAGSLAYFTFYGWALISLGFAAVAFMMFVDAYGHVGEIRDRPTTTLSPKLAEAFGAVDPRKDATIGQPAPSQSRS